MFPTRKLAIVILMLASLSGRVSAVWCQEPISTEPALAEFSRFTLGAGDVISVQVWKNPDLAAEVPVRPDGKITIPLVGEVEVAGKTPLETQRLLSERFAEFVTAPAVSVVVTQINSRKVFVLGEIQAPGAYDLVRPTRIVQMLAIAGGLTEWAKKDEIVVLREVDGRERRLVVSVKDITAGKQPSNNMLLLPGDTIIVP